MPVGVVVGGPAPKSRNQPTSSGMYGRTNSSTGWPFFSAPVPLANAGLATFWKAGSLRVASTRSLSAPGRPSSVERSAIVGWASRRSGRNSRRNGARSLVAGFESRDQRVEVVERRAQVHERRVAASQRRRQQRQRLGKRAVLGRDRAGGGVRVADEVGEVVTAVGDRAHRPRRGDDEAREGVVVLGRLIDEPAGAREQRVEVLRRRGGLRALAVELGLEARDDALEALARLRVERVEELVEVDRRRRRGRGQRRMVGQRPARVRPGRDRTRSGWRCPTATSAG